MCVCLSVCGCVGPHTHVYTQSHLISQTQRTHTHITQHTHAQHAHTRYTHTIHTQYTHSTHSTHTVHTVHTHTHTPLLATFNTRLYAEYFMPADAPLPIFVGVKRFPLEIFYLDNVKTLHTRAHTHTHAHTRTRTFLCGLKRYPLEMFCISVIVFTLILTCT